MRRVERARDIGRRSASLLAASQFFCWRFSSRCSATGTLGWVGSQGNFGWGLTRDQRQLEHRSPLTRRIRMQGAPSFTLRAAPAQEAGKMRRIQSTGGFSPDVLLLVS
jgi:hypothetical protein